MFESMGAGRGGEAAPSPDCASSDSGVSAAGEGGGAVESADAEAIRTALTEISTWVALLAECDPAALVSALAGRAPGTPIPPAV